MGARPGAAGTGQPLRPSRSCRAESSSRQPRALAIALAMHPSLHTTNGAAAALLCQRTALCLAAVAWAASSYTGPHLPAGIAQGSHSCVGGDRSPFAVRQTRHVPRSPVLRPTTFPASTWLVALPNLLGGPRAKAGLRPQLPLQPRPSMANAISIMLSSRLNSFNHSTHPGLALRRPAIGRSQPQSLRQFPAPCGSPTSSVVVILMVPGASGQWAADKAGWWQEETSPPLRLPPFHPPKHACHRPDSSPALPIAESGPAIVDVFASKCRPSTVKRDRASQRDKDNLLALDSLANKA